MSAKTIKLTEAGRKKLEEELDYLKTAKRREIAERLKEAISLGDLSENAEYDEAKNEQAAVEAKIKDLENKLKNVEIIDISELKNDKVSVGLKVKVHDKEFEEDIVFHIVGSTEADPFNDRISDESPVGQALLGKQVGDVVSVETPNGSCEYEILEIIL